MPHFIRIFSFVTLIFATLLWGCGRKEEPSVSPARESHQEMVKIASSAPPLKAGYREAAGSSYLDKAAARQKMVYKADIHLTVNDYKQVRAKLEQMAEACKGVLVSASEEHNRDEQAGDFTYRIPQSMFSAFLDRVRTLPALEPPNMQIQGNDVSEEMVDLDARLKAKQATEARLLDLMKQAKEANDLIAIANRLDEVQSEIEQIKGRIQYLNNQVDYSTVTLHLIQHAVSPATAKKPLLQQMKVAFISSIAKIKGVAEEGLILLSGILPVLLLSGAAAAVVLAFVRVRRRNKKE
jgi:hypothetical protein